VPNHPLLDVAVEFSPALHESFAELGIGAVAGRTEEIKQQKTTRLSPTQKRFASKWLIKNGVDIDVLGGWVVLDVSKDGGKTWSKAQTMVDTAGKRIGCARPRLLALPGAVGGGAVVLSGGRLQMETTTITCG
jgi:hypothetical protein